MKIKEFPFNDFVSPYSLNGIKTIAIILGLNLFFCPDEAHATINYFLYEAPDRSVTQLVNSTGVVNNNYEYDSFGNIKTSTETVPTNYKYVGEQLDPETGFINLRNRYYDPTIGRFITQDPFPGVTQSPKTINPYPYCSNNPVNRSDAKGLFIGWDDVAFMGAGALVGLGGQLIKDLTKGKGLNNRETYVGAAIGGLAAGEIILDTGNPILAGAVGNALGNETSQGLNVAFAGKSLQTLNSSSIVGDSMLGGLSGSIGGTLVNPLDGSIAQALSDQMITLAGLGETYSASEASKSALYGIAGSGFDITLSALNGLSENPNTSSGQFSDVDTLDGAATSLGGVDLNATAQLLGNVQDFGGATYDQNTGQIILYGQQNATLPPMDLDDLSVAIDSLYGLNNTTPADPSMTIGPLVASPGQWGVSYYGATLNTGFGATMYQSDLLLKWLVMGENSLTSQPFSASVPGYESMIQRYKNGGVQAGTYLFTSGKTFNRYWFTPQQITLAENADGSSMQFSQAIMQVLTESQYNGQTETDPYGAAFAQELTTDFNSYANEFPVLQQLTRLGKITSVVKWIQDNNIPFDLSYFSNYVPAAGNTPQSSPQLTISFPESGYGGELGNISITGGVVYNLDQNNFATTTNSIIENGEQAVVSSRPSETTFNWNFSAQDPNGNTDQFTAIAQSLTRSPKDGSVRFQVTDLSFPVEGDKPLALVRYYNSYYDKSSGFGYGWQLTPYSLRFPATPEIFTFNDEAISINTNYQIYVRDGKAEYFFTLQGLDVNKKPIYSREGGSETVRDNQDGTFTYFKYNQGTMYFGSQGQLTQVVDKNGIAINYEYNSNLQLTSIVHQDGRSIVLNYTGNNITSATGLGSKTVNYSYYPNGQLNTVVDAANNITTYSYDSNLRINKIVDPRNNTVYQAVFDSYNRANSQTLGSAQYTKEFNLADRLTTTTDSNNAVSTQLFDENYDLLQNQDFLNNTINFVYDPTDFGPDSMTDANGGITQYQYDSLGDVWYTQDANGGQKFYFYDQNKNLVATRDELGNDKIYVYDANNRLINVYSNATLNFTSSNPPVEPTGTPSYSYDSSYVTTYNYDSKGNLISSIDPVGRTINTVYDSNGLPLTVSYPSGYQTIKQYDTLSRLTSILDPAGDSTNFVYDNVDRITNIQTSAGQIRYSYDANGNISTVIDGNNNSASFVYDSNNNLSTVTDAAQEVTNYVYNATNNLTQITMPNGAMKQITYDEAKRPIMEVETISNPTPHILVTNSSINVGQAIVGYPITTQFLIYNYGDGPLSISNISIDNNIFTVSSQSVAIPAGGQATFNITMTASSVGSFSGKMTINSNDSINSSIVVSLSGNAIQGVYITTQPVNVTVTSPAKATFTVAAIAYPNASYQWRQSINGGTFTNISGATSSSYTTSATTAANNGTQYECVVSNTSGSVTSYAAVLTVNVVPSITKQPVSVTTTAGAMATFSVVASGLPVPNYQWMQKVSGTTGFTAINGANGSSYTIPSTTDANNGTQFECVVSNIVSTVTSNAATLTVDFAPTITSQPSNMSVTAPATAKFSVAAQSNPQATYQWMQSIGGTFTNISGATSSSYTTPATTLANSGTQYKCVISNTFGSVTSNTAMLTVYVKPSITIQPLNVTIIQGTQIAEFTLTVSGTPTPTYQWMQSVNGAPYTNIIGATNYFYDVPNPTTVNSGTKFECVVSNIAGSVTSIAVTLTVNPDIAPSISSQPANVTIIGPGISTFKITASGSPTPSYQWMQEAPGASTFTPINGYIGSSYTTSVMTIANSGTKFECVVSNLAGSITSTAATLTINAPVAPSITSQPVNMTAIAPVLATFRVSASGTPTPTYQWMQSVSGGSFTNISGATSSSYTVGTTAVANTGTRYECVVSNAGGSVTSNAATLTVNAPVAPSITVQPVNITVIAPAAATFSITASGSPTPTINGCRV